MSILDNEGHDPNGLGNRPLPDHRDARPRRVLDWAVRTFGDVALDPTERALRFVEKAIELGQAMGLPVATTMALVRRVYGREPGNFGKEIGQAQMTLEVLAARMGRNASEEADIEFARVQSIPKEEWTRRHTAKQQIGIAVVQQQRDETNNG